MPGGGRGRDRSDARSLSQMSASPDLSVIARLSGAARGLAVLLVLGACGPQMPDLPEVRGPVVPVDRAIDAFRGVCIDTAPTFVAATERLGAHGLIRAGEAGVVFDETGSLSIRVDVVGSEDGPMLRCSIVYEDPNRYIAREKIDRMLADLGTALGRGRSAQFPTVQGGTREGRIWDYSAAGRPGELFDVPHTGQGNLGVLMLQFPVEQT